MYRVKVKITDVPKIRHEIAMPIGYTLYLGTNGTCLDLGSRRILSNSDGSNSNSISYAVSFYLGSQWAYFVSAIVDQMLLCASPERW